jgi:hypothetical protein
MRTTQKNIDQLLESFDGIQKASAPDFFHTRLMAKLERDQPNQKSTAWGGMLKPLPILAVLGCLIALNIYTLSTMVKGETQLSTSQQGGIVSFASEYDLYNTADVTDKIE